MRPPWRPQRRNQRPKRSEISSLREWTRSLPIRTAGQIALQFSLLEARPAFAYQRIAVEAIRLHELGMSAVTIAKSLGVTDKTVVKAISWGRLTHRIGP